MYFWDESGFRADSVHGKTWGKKGQTPVVERPGQRQSVSAASAVNARGGFWYCTYQGGLKGELFVALLRRMMRRRSKPVHLVVDGLPAHKTTLVKTYVASTKGMLTLHFLPGYAPELNPDELVWSHMKRTGVSRAPLRQGEKLQAKIEAQLSAISACLGCTLILQSTKCRLYYRLVSNWYICACRTNRHAPRQFAAPGFFATAIALAERPEPITSAMHCLDPTIA